MKMMIVALFVTCTPALAWSDALTESRAEFRSLYKKLVEINTTLSAGIPTYGVSGIFIEPGKVNAHGLNEKIPMQAMYEGREFLDRLIRMYAGGE